MKLAAYLAYLASWLVFAIAAVLGALPQPGKAPVAFSLSAPVVIGTALQVLAAFAITRSMGSGPLNPGVYEMAGVLILAPFGAAIFVWALRSGRRSNDPNVLVTEGAYRWLRHPIYLAFLSMLVASGFLVSLGLKLLLPVMVYVIGSELRIAAEERELLEKFADDYPKYQRRTRWRYIPGLR